MAGQRKVWILGKLQSGQLSYHMLSPTPVEWILLLRPACFAGKFRILHAVYL